jgi:hypothetical protein
MNMKTESIDSHFALKIKTAPSLKHWQATQLQGVPVTQKWNQKYL